LLLEMEINGHPAKAMLDTGAGYSVVSRAFANRIGVTDTALEDGPVMHLAGLSPDAANGRLWRFEDARIGTERMVSPIMVVADLPAVPFDVLLGMDYLAMHRVWLSYGARRIFVAHQ
jgi:predicted aspartyl protease